MSSVSLPAVDFSLAGLSTFLFTYLLTYLLTLNLNLGINLFVIVNVTVHKTQRSNIKLKVDRDTNEGQASTS